MHVEIKVGDVLQCPADVLISTANPWLNLSGGVNGAILSAVGPAIQDELHNFLKSQGISAVPAGTVVYSGAGNLPFQCILHAVAIDPFYDSSIDLVGQTLRTALGMAVERGAQTVASPTLATGYGPLTITDFGRAVSPLQSESKFDAITLSIVVRSEEHRGELQEAVHCTANRA
ncbi:macro domain-containing protein [Crateriforma conspicua]|uniref:O-acetyl-ADP-ribose deacetylase n=1 Tax=Crateriforma conspicua TaxID=2527996 RepID=A0A5C6FIS7_9PLAN|nr:macro domain-containing protein [Crateriforma conspicua]TWU62020.1 O-acetyl-ADP-ribose deacetylase [Crateriforma conspicua]